METVSETVQSTLSILKKQETSVIEVLKRRSYDYMRCGRIPLTLVQVFIAKCKWISVLQFSIYMPASMSTLLLASQVCTQMFCVALFFQSSGSAQSKDADPECTPQGLAEVAGRMLAVGLVSSTCSAMVPSLFGFLHARDFVKFSSKDSPEWKSLLRTWRRNDKVLWIGAGAYTSWCIFFSALFLANVTEKDGLMWMVSVAIGLLKDVLILPLFFTIALLVLVVLSGWSAGVQAIIQERLALETEELEKPEEPQPELDDNAAPLEDDGDVQQAGCLPRPASEFVFATNPDDQGSTKCGPLFCGPSNGDPGDDWRI
jgi:hypothetical protein